MPSLAFRWHPEVSADESDTYIAFRATLTLPAAAEIDFLVLGATWYVGWIDGERLCEGPARFPAAFPEHQTFRRSLAAGSHVIGFVVNNTGVTTRLIEGIESFLACRAEHDGRELSLEWKTSRLTAFAPHVRRVNPQLSFIEWCDTRQLPDWLAAGFDDSAWSAAITVTRPLGPVRALTSAHTRSIDHALTPIAGGSFTETFGYERDDVSARFFLRDLAPAHLPPQGVWRRYDLGRVRLFRPCFELDLPAGTVVEFAYGESLQQGRVSPWITLSCGDSCNLDHFVARGGRQEFTLLSHRGGRFLEVHIFAPENRVTFHRESAIERAYYGDATGSLRTDDPLLNRIWHVGVETHRACAEDAITDNPTRERGQWAGDVVTVGLDVASVTFADLRLCRRSLTQCAQCARDDGLVAGLCPGGIGYLTTYAAQWISACLNYWRATGETDLLHELYPRAVDNLRAFEQQLTPDGLKDNMGWGFVDWGYVRNPGPSDMGVNLHYVAALRDMVHWCRLLGDEERTFQTLVLADQVTAIIRKYFDGELAADGDAWARIGYHRAALGLRLGFFSGTRAKAGRDFMKAHMLRCFPNNPAGPRLSDPAANHPQLITPYFGHFALPELIEHGDMDFVLNQYRTCWGWALQGSPTTWLEVFDTRWSHSHQWAGCPTWQLSRHLLGLRPRFDLGQNHFDVALATGSLSNASGTVPIANTRYAVRVRWTKESAGLRYSIESDAPLTLHLNTKLTDSDAKTVAVEKTFEAVWPLDACR